MFEEKKKKKEPWCPHCRDIPLFGCVACPRPEPRWKKQIKKMIKELGEEDEVYRSEQVVKILEEIIE